MVCERTNRAHLLDTAAFVGINQNRRPDSIGGEWPNRGTTQLEISHTSHAVVLFCGPFAEPEWAVFPNGRGQLSPKDIEALRYLQLANDQYAYYQEKALEFLSKPEVQQQIDRVARALLERTQLTEDEVREVAEFTTRHN